MVKKSLTAADPDSLSLIYNIALVTIYNRLRPAPHRRVCRLPPFQVPDQMRPAHTVAHRNLNAAPGGDVGGTSCNHVRPAVELSALPLLLIDVRDALDVPGIAERSHEPVHPQKHLAFRQVA